MRRVPHLATALSLLIGLPGAASADSPAELLRRSSVGGLTFDQRVACHRAIEQVYWRHRVWPEENSRPKPGFEEVSSPSATRAATEDSLLRSRALEELWGRPLTPEMLQAELDRIVRGTQRPDVLREIASALEHDPSRLAECLARPLLAERLLRERYSRDDRIHDELRRRATEELARAARPEELALSSGRVREIVVERDERRVPGAKDPKAEIGEAADRLAAERNWRQTREWLADLFRASGPDEPAMASTSSRGEKRLLLRQVSRLEEDETRFYAAALLEETGDRLEIVLVEWRKQPFEQWWQEVRGSLGAPRPTAPFPYRLEAPSGFACDEDTWRPTLAPLVDSEWGTAVWTGSEMLIWGGFPFRDNRANYGGRYDPATDSWQLIGTWNAPSNRGRHTAVWTGTEMIVWGGESDGFQVTNTGGRYDPATNLWTPTPTGGAPTPRTYHTAVWTGTEMVVWGGCASSFCSSLPATGGRYDPASDSWSPVATGSAPSGRYLHTAVWSGTEMIVWGGWSGSVGENSGGRYDPITDSWSPTTTSAAPSGRLAHSAVWTGDRMIAWGGRAGEFSSVYLATGGTYDPIADAWSPTSTSAAPSARDTHRAVWTGSEMIVFGGYDGSSTINTGGRYDPALDSWAGLSTLNAPSPRAVPATVWTGTEMIVWAGWNNGPALADGGRYSPASDSWVPVGLPQTPSERDYHSHVWTGTEVVVWGGCGIFAADPCPTDTGGLYDLVTDSWSPTSVVGAPTRREFHNAAWTGTEMLVWGGCGDVFCAARFNTGGRYDPAANSWLPMSTLGAPVARFYHDGVWTGTEMIIWGGCINTACTDTSPPLPRDGGRYDPATDSWTPTTLTGAPGGRWFATNTWTGTEMIVWGGQDMDVGRLDTGARYDPASDSWTPTSTTGAPIPRIRHRAHWTGDRLLVWGGDDFSGNFYQAGGSYDPATDTWSATTTVAAPTARSFPYTAWSGQELVVWGGLPASDDGGLYDPVADSWRPMTPVEAPTVRADLRNGAWTGNELVLFGGGYPDTLMETETGGVYCVGASAVGFQILPTPAEQTICAGEDAEVLVDVPSFDGFAEPVTLSPSGHPAGTTPSFSVNPVIPPGASTLTLSGTAAAAPGTYTLTITGTSSPSGIVHDGTSQLTVLPGTQDAPVLVAPADGATGLGLAPLLVWNASPGATGYLVEVDDDPAFGSPEFTTSLGATQVVATGLAFDTLYSWRVTAIGPCAEATSAVFEFTTVLFADGFESGDTSAWSTTQP